MSLEIWQQWITDTNTKYGPTSSVLNHYAIYYNKSLNIYDLEYIQLKLETYF